MISPALYHFPQIIFQDEIKFLWNPILKKAFKNLPEERVRLQLVEYLIEEIGFPKTRISFESPVSLPRDKSSSRTDLICYDKDFNVLLLVECKAPEVKLDAKVALQIARYNQQINAPILLVTNGLNDYWFTQAQGTLQFINENPDPFQSSLTPIRGYEYWVKRGFAGSNSDPDIKKWIENNCIDLYESNDSHPRYFSFDGTSPELGLPNFYRIFSTDEHTNLALSLSSTPFGATKLNAILNKNGENVALFSTSLDLLFTDEPHNSILQSEHGIQELDIREAIGFHFDDTLTNYARAISDLML